MGFKRALTWFSIFMVMLMVVLLPFVQSSRTSFQGGTKVAKDTKTATKDLETNLVNRFGVKGGSVLTIEDSAREVPTGPDPIHHNDNPRP